MQLITVGEITLNERVLAARFLRGSGIEIGAGHVPIEVDERCCAVRYVDRLDAAEIGARFPELQGAPIVPVDMICDVAVEGLRPFPSESLDFVVASHLLEHLPDPLGFLNECHRTLRDKGILYLATPDKDFTFDRERPRTPLSHIISDFERRVTSVDEEHLIDFITRAGKKQIPEDPAEREKLFQLEMARSIHVHVWTWNDMIELLEHTVGGMGLSWELVEAYLPKGVKNEAVFILQKTDVPLEAAIARLDASLRVLLEREEALEALIRIARDGLPEPDGKQRLWWRRVPAAISARKGPRR